MFLAEAHRARRQPQQIAVFGQTTYQPRGLWREIRRRRGEGRVRQPVIRVRRSRTAAAPPPHIHPTHSHYCRIRAIQNMECIRDPQAHFHISPRIRLFAPLGDVFCGTAVVVCVCVDILHNQKHQKCPAMRRAEQKSKHG